MTCLRIPMSLHLPGYVSSAFDIGITMQDVYARDMDWEPHRDTITRLYSDENRSLDEVMSIMEEEHLFFAK